MNGSGIHSSEAFSSDGELLAAHRRRAGPRPIDARRGRRAEHQLRASGDMDVGLQQIPVEEPGGRIDDALDEMPVIDVGLAEVHRRTETLLGKCKERHPHGSRSGDRRWPLRAVEETGFI